MPKNFSPAPEVPQETAQRVLDALDTALQAVAAALQAGDCQALERASAHLHQSVQTLLQSPQCLATQRQRAHTLLGCLTQQRGQLARLRHGVQRRMLALLPQTRNRAAAVYALPA